MALSLLFPKKGAAHHQNPKGPQSNKRPKEKKHQTNANKAKGTGRVGQQKRGHLNQVQATDYIVSSHSKLMLLLLVQSAAWAHSPISNVSCAQPRFDSRQHAVSETGILRGPTNTGGLVGLSERAENSEQGKRVVATAAEHAPPLVPPTGNPLATAALPHRLRVLCPLSLLSRWQSGRLWDPAGPQSLLQGGGFTLS